MAAVVDWCITVAGKEAANGDVAVGSRIVGWVGWTGDAGADESQSESSFAAAKACTT